MNQPTTVTDPPPLKPRQLTPLQPYRIGRLFGRRGSPDDQMSESEPPVTLKARFLLVGAAAVAFICIAAAAQQALAPQAAPSSLSVVITAPKTVNHVQTPLSQDPVAIVLIVVALLTPLFCAYQVDAIKGVVQMNEENYLARPRHLQQKDDVPIDKLNEAAKSANKWFERVGSRGISLLCLVLSAVFAYLIYSLVLAGGFGLLRSWNATTSSGIRWGEKVYAGWWANYTHHTILALALCAFGAYLFYFLIKQLALGAIFSSFAASATRVKFGVIPNVEYNSDGLWGLRRLRHFMIWTYTSTTAHFLATLGVFVVWLPFSQWTAGLAAVVMIINSVVVFRPSLLAYRSVLNAKVSYVKRVSESKCLTPEDKERYYDRIWNNPNLPFRTQSTVTAVTVYFLLPLALAVISGLISRQG